MRSFLLTCPGATCIPVLLPLTVLYLLSVCRSPAASVLQWPPPLPPIAQLWDPLAAVLIAGWITLQSFLYLLPVGKVRRFDIFTVNNSLQISIHNTHRLLFTEYFTYLYIQYYCIINVYYLSLIILMVSFAF